MLQGGEAVKPDDEAAIARAAEIRHQAQCAARQRAQAESDLDVARVELPRALSEDRREWRRFLKGLVRRVMRRLT